MTADAEDAAEQLCSSLSSALFCRREGRRRLGPFLGPRPVAGSRPRGLGQIFSAAAGSDDGYRGLCCFSSSSHTSSAGRRPQLGGEASRILQRQPSIQQPPRALILPRQSVQSSPSTPATPSRPASPSASPVPAQALQGRPSVMPDQPLLRPGQSRGCGGVSPPRRCRLPEGGDDGASE